MGINVPTVLASALLAAIVAVVTAGAVARGKARADRDVAARAEVRAAVQPVRQELALWARQGIREREPGQPVATDAEAVTKILSVMLDLPAWRRTLVRRRLRRLFGGTWVNYLELFPYDADNPMNTMIRASAYEHRVGGPTGEGTLLTAGLVHQTLSLDVFGGWPAQRLDRELRRLSAAR
ncbi:hypothetical protein [Geodermatophilus siccatus]|uniref:hypothetical protein n=1 Tax=Geodermatophilus siccatus TaxID=1137991 RepID=UPI0011146489|nr:hypothetical protein [Geodermatophilus siccatus]